MKVLVYTITRAATKERGRLLIDTLTKGRETAGHDCFWTVHCNGATLAHSICESALATGVIDEVTESPVNEGQHLPSNRVIKRAIDEDFDFIVRVDDDVEWQSKRWLAKLIEASVKLGGRMVLSPKVKGLRWQPPQSQNIEIEGIPIKIIDFKNPIGGICRLTPVALLKETPYVSDVRLPMGGGDATGVGNWITILSPLAVCAYVQSVNIRHAKGTDAQERDDPEHAKEHDIMQHLPFVPVLT